MRLEKKPSQSAQDVLALATLREGVQKTPRPRLRKAGRASIPMTSVSTGIQAMSSCRPGARSFSQPLERDRPWQAGHLGGHRASTLAVSGAHRFPRARLMSTILRPLVLATASWRSSAETNVVHPAVCAAATCSRSRLRAWCFAAYAVESSHACTNSSSRSSATCTSPLVLENLMQLTLDDHALFPRHEGASDEPLECVGNLELMNHSKRNVACWPQGRLCCI